MYSGDLIRISYYLYPRIKKLIINPLRFNLEGGYHFGKRDISLPFLGLKKVSILLSSLLKSLRLYDVCQ